MLAGVVSMPSNIFATTGTNVSILFLDKTNTEDVVLIDASNLGRTVKEGKNQKTVLSEKEEELIINTFNSKSTVEDLSIVSSYKAIENNNYSFSAGQYFEIKIDYKDISHQDFELEINTYKSNLKKLFSDSKFLEEEIILEMDMLSYDI